MPVQTNFSSVVEGIRRDLLSCGCPHVEATEATEQVASLLLENSNHRDTLLNWIGEKLGDCDSQPLFPEKELESLKTWQVICRRLRCSLKLPTAADDLDMKSARHYVDYILEAGHAKPCHSKTRLVTPRDLEKDVKISNNNQALKPEAFVDHVQKEIQATNQRLLGSEDVIQNDEILDSTQTLEGVKGFRKEYEMDFQQWVDRFRSVPDNNDDNLNVKVLGDALQKMQQSVQNNLNIRQEAVSVKSLMKDMLEM